MPKKKYSHIKDLSVRSVVRQTYSHAKETYSRTKEAYSRTKETYSHAKKQVFTHKRPISPICSFSYRKVWIKRVVFLIKETCSSAKETYSHSKETYSNAKENYSHVKDLSVRSAASASARYG